MKRERATEDVKHNFLKTTLFRIPIRLICQLLKDQEGFLSSKSTDNSLTKSSCNNAVKRGKKTRLCFFYVGNNYQDSDTALLI